MKGRRVDLSPSPHQVLLKTGYEIAEGAFVRPGDHRLGSELLGQKVERQEVCTRFSGDSLQVTRLGGGDRPRFGGCPQAVWRPAGASGVLRKLLRVNHPAEDPPRCRAVVLRARASHGREDQTATRTARP